ncbi:MAG: ATP-dependent helicase [bacterium]|nr:ATP-dependent helicase [bacterium]
MDRNPGKYSLPRREVEAKISSRWADELNEQQLAAVTAPDGPVLVLAGAGSGKTRVITYRAAFLISDRGIKPAQIMLATFTNKAARNMLARVEDVVGGAAREITGGTFHHIANLLLRRFGRLLGYDPSFTILDETDARQVMKLSRGDSGVDTAERAFPSDRLLVDIASSMVNSNLDLETLLAKRYPHLMDQFTPIQKVLIDYHTRKAASNQMDFDDMLVNFYRLLAEHAEAREQLAARYRHILVDEYQDVNHLQAAIVKALFMGEQSVQSARVVPARPLTELQTFDEVDLLPPIGSEPQPVLHGADALNFANDAGRAGATPTPTGRGLFVVGDDAQSIYSFRGADFENIRSFPYAFAGAQVYKLEVNYRSTPEILTLANAVLHEGDPMFRKELRPVRPSVELKPLLLACRDTREQAEFVAEQLMKLREDEDLEWKQMAVLYRAHSNRLETELELTKRGIPFVVRGGLRFFEQAHIKDLVSYLVLLANGRDELAWNRVLLMTQRVGPRTVALVLSRIRRVAETESPLGRFINNGIIDEVKGQGKPMLRGLQDFLRTLSAANDNNSTPSALIGMILDGRYQQYMELTYENWRQRLDDIEQLQVFAARFDTLLSLLAEVGLASGYSTPDLVSEDYDREEGAVTLSTVHQAKGLEWRAVILISVSDEVIPHRMSLNDPNGEDEERRLLYVAVTRAEEILFLSYPVLTETRDFQRIVNRPSRFIASLPKETYEEAVLEWD